MAIALMGFGKFFYCVMKSWMLMGVAPGIKSHIWGRRATSMAILRIVIARAVCYLLLVFEHD